MVCRRWVRKNRSLSSFLLTTGRLTHNAIIVEIRVSFLVWLRLRAWLLAVAALCWGGIAWAQAPGPLALILIAAPDLPDPNFARSVVLVTQTPVGEVIGVILNRPTEEPWPRGVRPREAPPPGEPAPDGRRRMHFGGPLIPAATFAIGAAAEPVADTIDLGAGLRFAVGLKNTLALAGSNTADGTPGDLKLFHGYAGWGPGQLEEEIAAGAWQVRQVSAELVFDPAPATQWERLTSLRRAVRASGSQRPATPAPERGYRPHVTSLVWP